MVFSDIQITRHLNLFHLFWKPARCSKMYLQTTMWWTTKPNTWLECSFWHLNILILLCTITFVYFLRKLQQRFRVTLSFFFNLGQERGRFRCAAEGYTSPPTITVKTVRKFPASRNVGNPIWLVDWCIKTSFHPSSIELTNTINSRGKERNQYTALIDRPQA